jgi:hypothetical protein
VISRLPRDHASANVSSPASIPGVVFLDGDHPLEELHSDVGWQLIDPTHDGLTASEPLCFCLELFDAFLLIHGASWNGSMNRGDAISQQTLSSRFLGTRYLRCGDIIHLAELAISRSSSSCGENRQLLQACPEPLFRPRTTKAKLDVAWAGLESGFAKATAGPTSACRIQETTKDQVNRNSLSERRPGCAGCRSCRQCWCRRRRPTDHTVNKDAVNGLLARSVLLFRRASPLWTDAKAAPGMDSTCRRGEVASNRSRCESSIASMKYFAGVSGVVPGASPTHQFSDANCTMCSLPLASMTY